MAILTLGGSRFSFQVTIYAEVVHRLIPRRALVAHGALLDAFIITLLVVAGDALQAGLLMYRMRKYDRRNFIVGLFNAGLQVSLGDKGVDVGYRHHVGGAGINTGGTSLAGNGQKGKDRQYTNDHAAVINFPVFHACPSCDRFVWHGIDGAR